VSERADEYLPLIAGHYEKAGDVAKAARFLRRAGQQALARGAPKEALSFCERALALLPAPLPSGDVLMGERIELLLALGETKRGLGQYAESQADFQTALGLARQANETLRVYRLFDKVHPLCRRKQSSEMNLQRN
jgi:tetratricopeptide (TPR) repeat protein